MLGQLLRTKLKESSEPTTWLLMNRNTNAASCFLIPDDEFIARCINLEIFGPSTVGSLTNDERLRLYLRGYDPRLPGTRHGRHQLVPLRCHFRQMILLPRKVKLRITAVCNGCAIDHASQIRRGPIFPAVEEEND